MSRYLLDTNIISEIIKPAPSRSLVTWMSQQADTDLFISSLTLAEIRRGILEKPAGRKRDQLEAWFAGPQGPSSLFAGRVLSFDERAAVIWAGLMAAGRRAGRPRNALDMVIVATAQANDCTTVTNNQKDFAGLETLNPMGGRR